MSLLSGKFYSLTCINKVSWSPGQPIETVLPHILYLPVCHMGSYFVALKTKRVLRKDLSGCSWFFFYILSFFSLLVNFQAITFLLPITDHFKILLLVFLGSGVLVAFGAQHCFLAYTYHFIILLFCIGLVTKKLIILPGVLAFQHFNVILILLLLIQLQLLAWRKTQPSNQHFLSLLLTFGDDFGHVILHCILFDFAWNDGCSTACSCVYLPLLCHLFALHICFNLLCCFLSNVPLSISFFPAQVFQ